MADFFYQNEYLADVGYILHGNPLFPYIPPPLSYRS